MGFTTTLRNNVLNHVFRNTSLTSPTTIYVALFVGNTEVTGGDYAREPITFGSPTGGIIKNESEVKFSIATADWGSVTQAVIFDSLTGGNRLDDAGISQALLVEENQQFSIPVGNYTIEVT